MAYWQRSIQTMYKDVLFKSRLEAKCAQGCDRLGLRWIYEPTSYLLASGKVYCPDLFLPSLNIWLEAKGDDRFTQDQVTIREFIAEQETEVLMIGYEQALFLGAEKDEKPYAAKCKCHQWRLQVLCTETKKGKCLQKSFNNVEEFLALTR